MKLSKSDLMYDYPEELVATHPQKPPRVLFKKPEQMPEEIAFKNLEKVFQEGDLLVINQTQVLPRRIFLKKFDVMFLSSQDQVHWDVLFPAKKFKQGDCIDLPEGVRIELIEKGRPQKVKANQKLTEDYFKKHAFFALPPYIQHARKRVLPLKEDEHWYQTQWAKDPGSLAAPTASLHFNKDNLQNLQTKIKIAEVTLHVGLGTFLPLTSENLDEHKMHSEYVSISKSTIGQIEQTLLQEKRVWALGTTSLRALEAYGQGHLQEDMDHYFGETDLFIRPGYEFKICKGLLTNFHQPGSSLISLVSAFAGYSATMKTYKWAIENKFRLFSYGDLSVWMQA